MLFRRTLPIYISIAILAAPAFSPAEQITVIDAACSNDYARVCLGILKIGPESRRPKCLDMESAIRSAKYSAAKRQARESFDRVFPHGCGNEMMALAQSITDCMEYSRLYGDCYRKVEVMTPADIKMARDDFTAQLDAWLTMLENAGAVNLGDDQEANAASVEATEPKE